MDPVRNPFAPGAGSQPPELAGREEIITTTEIALKRILLGRPAQSQMLLGLHGVGKTVLLNRIEQVAEKLNYLTSFIEAPEDRTLADLLYPKIYQVLRKLSLFENAKTATHNAMRALRSFASVFKISMGDFEVSVDPEPGVADSGNLEYDITELFFKIGEAAKAAGRGWVLLIDEVQYLSPAELGALIVAIHRINQKALPVLLFGAGLPAVAALSGDAKSYAERLFIYPKIDALNKLDAANAIRQPIESEGESIDEDFLYKIVNLTKGYPYFLQEWGFQVWNASMQSPISIDCIQAAEKEALRRLDEGFFKVRIDRLTPKEREYVIAMAQLGAGPYRSAEVADKLGEKLTTLGPRRAQIIAKGMIYSPAYGDIAFTVPMFDEYLKRHWIIS
ncbi:ATP-binding protein [Acetobacter farinalis]|uniref:ATP-binding protein n=1 Tax=Acetobacter farinalis TaxID=1260984 RepID=A0ABT3Q7H6_9PROT|nr:ATP-binding protein [Acetobacter farinalis]MCX2561258.1 ATP-binding protein [Acetobacter farinalis]NHO29971.1 AAA family ATPase [Acetobacter farinalis]